MSKAQGYSCQKYNYKAPLFGLKTKDARYARSNKRYQLEEDLKKQSRIQYNLNAMNLESTQQSDKTLENEENQKTFGYQAHQKNLKLSKLTCRSTVSLNCNNGSKLHYCDLRQQKGLNLNSHSRFQKQNLKLKVQNQKLNLQVSVLKNEVYLLRKFKTYYEQAQLQIQLLEKKALHYQNDIAYYQKELEQVNRTPKNPLEKTWSEVKIKAQSNFDAIFKCDFSFCPKGSSQKQLVNSFSINYFARNQRALQASKILEEIFDLDSQSSDSNASQGSQQTFSLIKYDQQIVFGDQFF